MVDEKKTAGPKTEDSKRDEAETNVEHTAAADAYLEDTRGRVFGDNTSSTGGANNFGQHGRDGGEVNQVSSNPAPSENAVSGESADDSSTGAEELQHPAEEKKAAEIKKL